MNVWKQKPLIQHIPTTLQHHPSTQDLHSLLKEKQEHWVLEAETIVIYYKLVYYS